MKKLIHKQIEINTEDSEAKNLEKQFLMRLIEKMDKEIL